MTSAPGGAGPVGRAQGSDVPADIGEPRGRRPAVSAGAVLAQVRSHWVLTLVVLAGLVVRLAYVTAYWPVFIVRPDSWAYLDASSTGMLDPTFPFGYSVLLALLRPLGSFAAIAAVQHLFGLGLTVLGYALLRRQRVARWLAAVAVAPLAVDAWQISLEHYVMADTLFTGLLLGGLALLLWSPRPSTWQCLGAGLLLAAAGLTRTVGLPVVAVALGYVLWRRLGWRSAIAFGLAATLPVVAYATVFAVQHGVFGLGEDTSRRYYGRAAQIVDCDRVPELDARERRLCPPEPLGQRRAPDEYGLFPDSPAAAFAPDDPIFGSFVGKVFRAQPVDLAVALGRDFTYFFRSTTPTYRVACLHSLWVPQAGSPPCRPYQAQTGQGLNPSFDEAEPPASAVARAVRLHGFVFRTPPFLLLLIVLLVVAVSVARVRVAGPPVRGTWLLLTSGLVLLAMAVLGAMYDARYAIPAVPLFTLAGALALHGLPRRQPDTSTS